MSLIATALEAWLERRLGLADREWLGTRAAAAGRDGANAAFLMAFGAIPRRLGKENLGLDARELRSAEAARHGWDPSVWTVDQAARTRLVLALPHEDAALYERWLNGLFDNGDVGELVALYQALPLLPFPELHRSRAAEGIRSNMKAVFEAIALRNPYPSEELSEDAFNQLVLKCLFVESPLHFVQGVDARVNGALGRMLRDYAHERWAAGRPVSPELWRAVGPVAGEDAMDDLRRVLANGGTNEQLAVALASAPNPRATALRSEFPEIFERIERDPPSWSALSSKAD